MRDPWKVSSEDDKQSRFEEGKPADPTKNMSPEDAKEWKAMNDKHKDNFKSAASASELKEMQELLKEKGYDPKDAKKLQGEGMGTHELERRLKEKGGLERTHNLKKKTAASEDDRINRLVQSIEGDLEQFKSSWKKYQGDPGKFKPQLENAKRDMTAIGTATRTAIRTLEGLSKTASLRKFIRLANMKFATINDQETLEGLLEMEIESIDGDKSEASLNSEIKSAAKAFDAAVEKALHEWATKNLDKFDLEDGPLHGSNDADDVVGVLMDLRGGAGYLYFMEAEGHGVGTWDGDWDPCFKETKTIEELSKWMKGKIKGQYQKLKSALEDRAMELVPEPDEE
jgi:hypothetical protein